MQPIFYFTYHNKSAFIPLRSIYPECFILREPHPQVNGLQCLRDDCPANRRCMETLAHRVHYMYDKVFPQAEILFTYFKDNTGSIKAGVFDKDFTEARVITCNRSAFDKFQKGGQVFEWTPPDDFFLIRGNTDLIAPETLIRG